ncbi:MAG: class I SAM-dependent methyltransferase [Candidatus Bathyarchaeia archaeon]
MALNESCLVLGAGPETAQISELAHDTLGINICMDELRAIKDSGVDAHLIRADAQKLPLKSSYFGFVLCRATLHHLGNLNGALTELNRVLKRGSHVYLHEPGILNFAAFLGRRFFPTDIHDPTEKPFNPIVLRKTLLKNFKIVKEEDLFIYAHVFPVLGKRLPLLNNRHLLKAMFGLDNALSKTFLGNLCWIFIFVLRKN